MAKLPRLIRTKLPAFKKDRQQWRKEILANVLTAAERVEFNTIKRTSCRSNFCCNLKGESVMTFMTWTRFRRRPL